MSTIQTQLEKMAHDIKSGPDLTDSIQIAVMGGAIGGLIGFVKDKNRKGAVSLALWGAGLGIAGQYMIFHMLKPALKTFGSTAHEAALATPSVFAVRAGAESVSGVNPETTGWGHGEMMGSVPYPHYYAWWE